MDRLSSDIAALSPKQRALLELRLGEKRPKTKETCINRQSREAAHFPLTFAQERLWFIDQLEPDSANYNLSGAVRLRGTLNVRALKESLNEIVKRHEILRTTFGYLLSRPVQFIAESLTLMVPEIDLQQLSRIDQENELHRIASQQATRRFDLPRGPMLRASLVRLGEQEHVFLFTIHHIISDGWSLRVFVNEMASCYEAFSAGRQVALADLPIQYADFAVWQRDRLENGAFEPDFSYWRNQLAGAPPLLTFTNSRPRPAIQTSSGAGQSLVLPDRLAEELRALSREEGVTLFVLLLAAFNVLLSYYTERFDILVGFPVASRNRTETEELIGIFVNMLVLRTDLSNDPTVKELLRRVHGAVLDGLAHQDAPFERLVGELRLQRSLSYNPLFQVAFVLDSVSAKTIELPGLVIDFLEVKDQTVQFDLVLHLIDNREQITGSLQYNTSLFDPTTADQILEDFETILRLASTNVHVRMSELRQSLTETHRQRFLAKERELEKTNALRLRNVKRKPVGLVLEDGGRSV